MAKKAARGGRLGPIKSNFKCCPPGSLNLISISSPFPLAPNGPNLLSSPKPSSRPSARLPALKGFGIAGEETPDIAGMLCLDDMHID